MSNALKDYLDLHLSEKLRQRRVVLFYDPRHEFRSYMDSLGAGPTIKVGELSATLLNFDGSCLQLKHSLDLGLAGDRPEPTLAYLPIERDRQSSVLMEYELAGETYEPQLRRTEPVNENKTLLG